MSRSSIFGIDQSFYGEEIKEYPNSWFFAPIVWGVLLDKYMAKEIQTPYGYKKSLIGNWAELQPQLNEIVNNCGNLADRICWELSMQQVFFSENKEIASVAIKEFLENNNRFDTRDGVPVLELDHIKERFIQISEDIVAIDGTKYPCFVFKNTSVDDSVESWFYEYIEDDESEDYRRKSLRDWDFFVVEFVKIKDGKISFATNLEFFGKEDTDATRGG